MRGIIDALKRTRLDGLSARIKLGFDANGKVIDAALLSNKVSTSTEQAFREVFGRELGVPLRCGVRSTRTVPRWLV